MSINQRYFIFVFKIILIQSIFILVYLYKYLNEKYDNYQLYLLSQNITNITNITFNIWFYCIDNTDNNIKLIDICN